MPLGLLAALVAAVLYGVAPVAQTVAAQAEPSGSGLGLRLLVRLARRPLWLAGIGCEAAGFLVELYAFSAAPAALVAPVMAADAAVATLLARRVRGERLSRAGYAGVASMILGVGLLAAVAGEPTVGAPAGSADMVLFAAFGGAVAALAAYRGRPEAGRQDSGAALWLGAGAGVCYAVATLATRQLGLQLGAGGALWRLATTPAPYLLVVFSLAATGLFQRGLQYGGAALTFPLASGLAALLPVGAGLALLGEATPGGAGPFVAAVSLVAAGIVLLGRGQATLPDPTRCGAGPGSPGPGGLSRWT